MRVSLWSFRGARRIYSGSSAAAARAPRLKVNKLARELFWFGEEHNVTLSVGWVPRGQNSLAIEISKLVIPHD